MNTRRKWMAAGMAWPALAWTGALRAQTNPPVIIGWLEGDKRERMRARLQAFHEGMAALGWKHGAQYVLEERYAEGRVERLAVLAQEIAAMRPAVILANGSSSAKAATAAAPTTPIVLYGGDPVTAGLVTSLARPGSLITGLSSVLSEAGQKVIELLVEAIPKLRRVGFLVDSTSAIHSANVRGVRQAAERLRFEPVIAEVAKPEDIEPAFAQLAKAKVQALVIVPSPWFGGQVATIIASALAQRWPVVGTGASTARQGALFGFGPDPIALARRSASYVDRILKGAKPGDLPIEQPTTFEFILNMKTAKTLGITIAPSMRLRATEVIE